MSTGVLIQTAGYWPTRVRSISSHLLLGLLLLLALPAAASADDCPFFYWKPITVQPGKVSGGPQTNFPMLVSLADSDLKYKDYTGGHIQNSSGYDIIFRALDDTTCGGEGTSPCTLSHEIEKYTASTGELIAWVKVPSLNDGTIIYMYYGNSCISSSTENKTDVWDSNFKGVWHLKENAAPYSDSTSNGNNSNEGTYPTPATGAISEGQDFDGSSTYINVLSSPSLDIHDHKTIEAWIYPRSFDAPGGVDRRIVIKKIDSSNCYQLTTNSYNNNAFAFGHLRNGSENTVFGGSNLSTNRWYHVVGIWNGSSTIYINGQPANSGTGIWYTGTTSDLRIGNRTNGDGFSNGIIDEVRISNIARSADWIKTEYNNQSSPPAFYSLGSETVVGLPTIIALSPDSAIAGGSGFTLTANGTNFVSGSVVKWNGSSRTTTYISAAQLSATIANSDISATGTALVAVENPFPDGGTSDASTFTIDQFTLTYTAGANGSITGTTPQTVNYEGSGTAVTAVPNTGYHFVQWSDGVLTPSRTDVYVTANISVTASFAINQYTLTYASGGNGTISGTRSQTVNYGGSGTAVTAVPATGYHFVNWSDGSTANPRTDTNVTGDLSVTAGFALNRYTLTVNLVGSGSVIKDPDQSTGYYGEKVLLTAAAAAGWTFVGWGADSSGTENPKFVTMDNNKSVTATFRTLLFLPLVIRH